MPVSHASRLAVCEHFYSHGNIRAAARAGNCSFGAAKRILRAAGSLSPRGDADPAVRETETAREVEWVSDTIVRTEQEAVAYAKVDLSVWRVKRWECGGWSTTVKVGPKGQEKAVVKQNWRVRLFLERLLPKTLHAALDGLAARLESHAPDWTPRPLARSGVPAMAVVDLVDVHFGKLAWAAETGQNYDLKIADQVYRNAVRELLSRCSGFDVEEFLLPLGSDFLHVDNMEGTTSAGTPQDTDGRLAKIVGTAFAAAVFAVEELAKRGLVCVRWVPGNHDRVLSYMLARELKAYFRNVPTVAVDVEPTSRKYHHYHDTLIGLTHGDRERPASLPVIMATEVPAEWAAATCREWHTGHWHKSRRVDHVGLDTHDGVPVRTLRSLSAVDAWHHRQGYVGSRRAAELYLYERGRGYVGHFVANARESA